MTRFKSLIGSVLDDTTTRLGFASAIVIQALIMLSLVAFAVETLPNLPVRTQRLLDHFETFVVAVFSVEYVLRFLTAPNPLRFAVSFFGVMDLLAVLPYYLTESFDFRSARAFRLLRLIRIFKLARYNAAVRRFHRAFLIAKEELILFLVVALLLLYFSAVGIYYCEFDAQPDRFSSVFHSLWWSVATLTTVGYGDIYPVTVGGKIFTFVVLIVGLGVVSVPAGLVASALAKAREMEVVEPEP